MKDQRTLAVIPARRGSTRLPNKILRPIGGTSLLERVWRRSSECQEIDRLCIATDDDEICAHAKAFGAEVMMTDPDLPSGSARVAAAAALTGEQWDIILNVQGDMPFIHPGVISQVVHFMKQSDTAFDMVTIAIPIVNEEEFRRETCVKVVVSNTGRALYFSRAAIPHSRDGDRWQPLQLESDRAGTQSQNELEGVYGLKHIGLYAFRDSGLRGIEEEYESRLEPVERLEQLKLLELGLSVGVCIVDRTLMEESVEIDTEEDVIRAESLIKRGVFPK